MYSIGRVADAFAVVHNPVVDHRILWRISPSGRITTVVWVALEVTDVVAGVQDGLLTAQITNLRAIGGDLGVVGSLLALIVGEQLVLLILSCCQLVVLRSLA